ncbi:MAG: hypothetical protein IPI67_13015 [Myxococcales bacterium]|nr:hypothetical protein [Myxococcales bacterium]
MPTSYHLASPGKYWCAREVVAKDVNGAQGMVVRGENRAARATDDPVERAVTEIRHLSRAASIELALGVGGIVFRHLFKGDLELVRRNGPKEASFRRLALHPELPMSAASLWRAVAIFELSTRVPLLTQSKHLGVTHVHAVLGLPGREQEQLLGTAERERWTPAALRARAAGRRGGHGGRRPKLEILRALDGLRRLAAVPLETFGDRAAVATLSAEDIEVALVALRELDERLVALRALLREASS